jgi:hypothetical protein
LTAAELIHINIVGNLFWITSIVVGITLTITTLSLVIAFGLLPFFEFGFIQEQIMRLPSSPIQLGVYLIFYIFAVYALMSTIYFFWFKDPWLEVFNHFFTRQGIFVVSSLIFRFLLGYRGLNVGLFYLMASILGIELIGLAFFDRDSDKLNLTLIGAALITAHFFLILGGGLS